MEDVAGFDGEAKLRITGALTEKHSVPFDVLVRVLDGMQQTVYLLAASETRQLKRRFKLPAETRARYQLKALVPEQGSYALPISIGPQAVQLGFDASSLPQVVLLRFYDVLDAIHRNDDAELMELIPDSAFLQRALRELLNFLPRPGDSWGVGFSFGSRSELTLDTKTRRLVETWLKVASTGDEALMTVTGELQRIDFEERKVVIRYKPDRRKIECFYLPEVEQILLASPRELIQVTGQFILDEDNHPTKMSEVSLIEAVDLSQMTFTSVNRDGRTLAISPPLVVTPVLDEETNQYLEVREDALGLFAFANNRELLVDEIEEQLFFLWDEYAMVGEDTLVEAAQGVRLALLERLEEVK